MHSFKPLISNELSGPNPMAFTQAKLLPPLLTQMGVMSEDHWTWLGICTFMQ